MRLDTVNTRALSLSADSSTTSMKAAVLQGPQGPQGLPGVGSAAWTAATAVTTGTTRQAPDGSWIKSTASRTTRATFDATEQTFWTVIEATPGTLAASALSATIGSTIIAAVAATGSAIWYALASVFSLRGAVDPREFGVVGDGVTDDTAAFRAAIAAAGPGGAVKIPHKFTIKVAPAVGNPFDISGVTICGSAFGGSTVYCTQDRTIFKDIAGDGTQLRRFELNNPTSGARVYPDVESVNCYRLMFDHFKMDRSSAATGAPALLLRKDPAAAGPTLGFMPIFNHFWLRNGWMKIVGVTDGKMSNSFVWGTTTAADGTIEMDNIAGWTFTGNDVIPPSGGDGAGYLFSGSISVNNAIIGGYVDGSYSTIMTGHGLKSTATVRGLRVIGVGFYNLGKSGIKASGMAHGTVQGCMFSQNNKADNFYPDVDLIGAIGMTFGANIHRAPDARTNPGKVYVEDATSGDNLYADMTLEIDPSITPNGHYYDPSQFSVTDSALIRNPRPNSRWRFNTAKIITSAYTVTVYDLFQRRGILVGSGAAIAMPSAGSEHLGDYVMLKNTSSSASVVITPSGAQTIDGASTWTLLPRQSVTLMTDSTNWVTFGNDSTVAHTAGAETIAGVKTFTSSPVVPDGSFAESKVINLVTDLAAKAADSAVVHNTGTETIAGAKTMTGGLTVTGAALTSGNGLRLLDGTSTGAAALATSSATNRWCDATSGAFTVTLPATTQPGIEFRIKKIDASANAVTVSSGGGTIDGAATYVLSAQWSSVTVVSTGTSGVWRIINKV